MKKTIAIIGLMLMTSTAYSTTPMISCDISVSNAEELFNPETGAEDESKFKTRALWAVDTCLQLASKKAASALIAAKVACNEAQDQTSELSHGICYLRIGQLARALGIN